tara:strand:- start:1016 stop:1228 length:213 start_codon:yes stop_codon:yes gene_type:complete
MAILNLMYRIDNMEKVINVFKWILSFLMLCVSLYILDKHYPDLCLAIGLGFIGFKLFESTLPKYERYVRD